MTHYLILESIWLISLSLFPYMHKYDSSFIISPMDMAILHAKLVWLSVATITTSFSIWLRLSIETLNQYSQNESWLRLSIETLNHPPKTTIVSSPSLFVTVTNEDRDWPVNTNLILFLNWSFQNHHVCGTDFFLYLISKQVKVLASIFAEKEAVHYEGIFCSFFLIIFLARFSQMVLNIARLGKRKGSSYIHGQTSVDS